MRNGLAKYGKEGRALLGALLLLSGAAPAQAEAVRDAVRAQPAASTPTLANTALPVAQLDGEIALSSISASSWRAEGITGLFLEGDVRLRFADYAFRCRRAVVWLAPSPDDPGATQVFAYLFDVGAPEADAAVSMRSERLPVHGVIRDADGLSLSVPVIEPERPDDTSRRPLIREAEISLRELLRSAAPAPVAPQPIAPPAASPDPLAPPPPQDPAGPIFESGGTVYLAPGDRVTTQSGRDANTVTLTGGVVIQYAGPTRSLELTARRAVVFLRPGPLRDAFSRFDESDVLGIYLEGGVVATDGAVTLRGPRIYYDLRADRALVLDAVFHTYDARLRAPLYLRAAAIRQEAAAQFTADRATMANTSFARPHLALGVNTVTIERQPRPQGGARTIVDATGVVPRLNNVPFFYVPRFRGDPERLPIRNIGYEDSDSQGFVVRTEWDPFVLLGIEGPPGVNSTLLADYYDERGLGIGTETSWNTDRQRGDLYAYMLPNDNGVDLLRNSIEVDRFGEFRGAIMARHQTRLTDEWTLTLEGSHISDETFLPAFDPNRGRDRYEITNRVHLRKLDENRLFTAEVKAASNDFAPAEHQLQSPGYRVDKLPEIEAKGIAEDLSSFFEPGLITYSWDAGFASVRQRFTEIEPIKIGVFDPSAFGVTRNEPIADFFRDQGLNESIVNRFDTRHEIGVDLDAGPLQINPFVVGRLTAYDSDFSEFSPQETDNARAYGAAGVRIATSFYRVDDTVESRTLDLHRMRHIIEPSVTLWHGESTIASEDLPVFDDDVEQLAEGSAVRLGIDQTWQTKRGGPGRWRDVDVFQLNFGWTFAGNNTDRGGPVPRWYDPRPELSSTQRAVDVQGLWQVSEIVSLAADWVYNVEVSQASRASVGAAVRHGRGVTVTGELRTLREQGDTYGNLGLRYPFGDKYTFSASTSYNFERDEFARYRIIALRTFPNGQLGVSVTFDNTADETSFGFVFQPSGLANSIAVSGVGSSRDQRSGF
ncbi:MAG: LPS assembly protein LptD [Planctomycetota bacterium]